MPRAARRIRQFGLIALLHLGISAAVLAAPVNVALNQPVSASSVYADVCAAAKANDGSDNATESCGGWSPDGTDAQSWLQIDLGSAKQISSLELVTRQNCCDQPETRQDFEIRASNDPTFASYVVLASQGSTPLPFKASWSQSVTDTNSYRYIRAIKTGYFFIAELRVWSASATPPPPSGNLALNRPASASSVYADACAAAKANDGSDNVSDSCGGWSPDGTDAEAWWQVDLGSAYTITTLELVTRQNCCDQPETRQNFEIRASNDPNFASFVVLGAQGSTVLPFRATWTQTVNDPNGYRYIRATKPGYFFIAELRVFGNLPSSTPASNLYYIYADHLNTARVITDTTNKILWRYDQADPFAASLPDEDPDNNGQSFEFNPRFPGQYYDKEAGLHYNYHRTYNPGTGAYTTVDPLGLAGGSFSTYQYAFSNPLSYIDPLGLAGQCVTAECAAGILPNPKYSPVVPQGTVTVTIGRGVGVVASCSIENGRITNAYIGFGAVFGTSLDFTRPALPPMSVAL